MHHKSKINSEETVIHNAQREKNTGFDPKSLGSQGFEQSSDRW